MEEINYLLWITRIKNSLKWSLTMEVWPAMLSIRMNLSLWQLVVECLVIVWFITI